MYIYSYIQNILKIHRSGVSGVLEMGVSPCLAVVYATCTVRALCLDDGPL